MRVLMTTDTVGGVWTYTRELVAALIARAHSVALVIVGPGPSALQTRWLETFASCHGTAFQWECCAAPLEWMSSNDGAYCNAASRLCSLARAFGADLLHSNQFCFGALPVEIPKVVVAHSDVLSWAAACRQGTLEPGAWLDTYIALVSAGIQAADTIVAPTQWMLGALAAHFYVPRDARVFSNGRTVLPAQRDLKRKLQAVTAGRLWDEGKNVSLMTEVQCDLPILVAGEAEYDSQAVSRMNSAIRLLGRLEEDALLDLFRESAVYVCTSRYEPFGLAPLEAALCGCAVLANDIPSLREVWGDGALYFNDALSLSSQLARLSMHRETLASAQQASWTQAQRYPASSMAGEYLALYQSMTSSVTATAHAT